MVESTRSNSTTNSQDKEKSPELEFQRLGVDDDSDEDSMNKFNLIYEKWELDDKTGKAAHLSQIF